MVMTRHAFRVENTSRQQIRLEFVQLLLFLECSDESHEVLRLVRGERFIRRHLALPELMAANKSASLIFWTSSEEKSFTFIILPVAVSPLPSGPWQPAHFALYVASAAAESAFAGALRKTIVASTTAITVIPAIQLVVLRMFPSS